MDSNRLTLLTVNLNAQMTNIRAIHQKIVNRSTRLQSDDEAILESIAYQIHNLYCATEDLLKIVAGYFENNISNSSQWHSLLLQRMSIEIPNIRPAFLTSKTYSILNSLRGFRHFFRHAYGAAIEYDQLKSNLDKSLVLLANLESDLNQFIAKLSPQELELEDN
jgi:hypothetical protein